MQNMLKDTAVVLTDEVRHIIEAGGAARMLVPNSAIKFGNNPRKRKGFDPESMNELQDTIAEDGLLENIILRRISADKDDPVYAIVAGERRVRAMRSLIEEDCLVYNQTNGRREKASEVYSMIPALVQGNCTDDKAIRLAFLENDKRVDLAQDEVIDLCIALEEIGGKSRKEISQLLGKSQAWLSHTYAFRTKLTAENYEKLRSGEINRSVAVRLMDYDAEDQTPIIDAATELAVERVDASKQKAEQELADASRILEESIREKMALSRQKVSDPGVKQTAQQKVGNAEKKVRKATERQKQVEAVIPAPSQSDVAEAAFRIVGAAHSKNLNAAQVREHYVERARNLIAIGDGEDPIDIATGFNFLRRDLELVALVADAIANGNRDFTAIIRQFYFDTGTWSNKGLIKVRLIPNPPRPVEDDSPDEDDIDEVDVDCQELDDLNWDDQPRSIEKTDDFDLSSVGDSEDFID